MEELLTAEAPPLGELEAVRPYPARIGHKGNLVYKLITTTDHKLIGIMYCVACFIFFFIGGLLALLMRTELARSFRISSTSVGKLMSAANMKTETAIDRTVSKVLRRLRDRLRSTSGNRFITPKAYSCAKCVHRASGFRIC